MAQLVLLTVVLALTGVALVVVASGKEGGASATPSVTSQVVRHVETLLTYRPDSVLADLDSEVELLTGDFAEEFAGQFRRTTGPEAQAGGVSASATVAEVGVVSDSADQVTFLMFVNVAYTTATSDRASTRGSRLEVVARRVDGAWRVASLEPV